MEFIRGMGLGMDYVVLKNIGTIIGEFNNNVRFDRTLTLWEVITQVLDGV